MNFDICILIQHLLLPKNIYAEHYYGHKFYAKIIKIFFYILYV